MLKKNAMQEIQDLKLRGYTQTEILQYFIDQGLTPPTRQTIAKYYKMDGLSRLGLISAELLLRQEGRERFVPCDDRAVILFNKSSSIVSDRKFLETITGEDNYFPSPSVFIYTLPNLVAGEIAMRNKYHGETSFYITSKRDDDMALEVITSAFSDKTTNSVLGGWIDYRNDNCFEADLIIAKLKY